MKNSRGQKLLDTFRVLPRVYFMHTICHFEALEFRSPTLQMVRKLDLKRRSYGRLKTTTSSCAKILQLSTFHYENFAATKSACENFARCFAAAKPPASTRVPLRKLKFHFCSCETSCEITSKLQNHKFNLQNQSSNFQNG